MEARGGLVIRKLCILLSSTSIYTTFAILLVEKGQNSDSDYDYISIFIQTLNLILLTASELLPLRCILQESHNSDLSTTLPPPPTTTITNSTDTTTENTNNMSNYDIFIILYKAWIYNPTATISICLLSQAYILSSALVLKFAEIEITVGMYMCICLLCMICMHVCMYTSRYSCWLFLFTYAYYVIIILTPTNILVSYYAYRFSYATGQVNTTNRESHLYQAKATITRYKQYISYTFITNFIWYTYVTTTIS